MILQKLFCLYLNHNLSTNSDKVIYEHHRYYTHAKLFIRTYLMLSSPGFQFARHPSGVCLLGELGMTVVGFIG